MCSGGNEIPHDNANNTCSYCEGQVLFIQPSDRYHATWKAAVAWVNGVDDVFNSINEYEVLPSGTAKIKVPVVPVELALKPVGKFESDVGELVVLPAVKRM